MTLIEDDLLAALKELYETSKVMTAGQFPSSDDLDRYQRALAWTERVIKLAEARPSP